MAGLALVAIDRPEAKPLAISLRLRSQLIYFAAPPGAAGAPAPAEGELWFDPVEVGRWLDEGVIELISPLDTAKVTEVELSDEQEAMLRWLADGGIRHVRLTGE